MTEPNPLSPHIQPQPPAQARCWLTFLHFRCITCPHRTQVNESPVPSSIIVISSPQREPTFNWQTAKRTPHYLVFRLRRSRITRSVDSQAVLAPIFRVVFDRVQQLSPLFQELPTKQKLGICVDMHHHLLAPSRDATLLDACSSTSSARLGNYRFGPPHLLSSRRAITTTSFLLFRGFSIFSVDGDPEGIGRRAPITERLFWAWGDDSDHDFATPRFNGD